MTTPDSVDAAAAPAASTGTPDARREAVRGLEGAFSELMGEFRRVYAQAAEAVSPGMLPGTFKVLSLIQRSGSITVSGLAERMAADKGQVSRSVTELEELGFVERVADAADGRIKLISVTPLGLSRLDVARLPYEGRLHDVLLDWPVETIEQLTALLHALAVGETPEA
ncbi:MarR family winged helix-turn-helix transcriptional regulator [Protaetiibacter mangrovi]|uniref:MarR family transcriptional regulator n=1 Tax=Protaetiibacter mangrovi TaxID=2970926 RepID=A0ABT1ZGT2_9MICO|nr:MarR family transcriptional regulator [Protaetiibacter mangrovi]MCS0499933.1 MarR family transcriptional regulator [Protaetiibacter mangrovi]TPW97648.1 MarR family transcriptional regulator [Schumannella luteola]